MPSLNIHFIGAQVYVPNPATDTTEPSLEVYLPNATKMGNSPQKDMDMHMPSMWLADQYSYAPRACDKLRYFPWSKLNFNFTFENRKHDLNLSSLQAAGGPESGRLKVSQALLSDPGRLGGQVSLHYGEVRVPRPDEDPVCTIQGWAGDAPSFPNTAVVNRVYARVDGLSSVTISFTSLLDLAGETPEDVTLNNNELNHVLMIGNPCAESVLRWTANNEPDYTDEDFAWIYQLVHAPPVNIPRPILQQRMTLIAKTDTPRQVLQNIHLGGGGGVGCECMGCIGETGGS